jgi:ferric-dicitrate binding protein FerR (iron transport regulator)
MRKKGKREDFAAALTRLRAAAREEERDWPDADWLALVEKAASQRLEPRPLPRAQRPRFAWRYATLILFFVGLAAVFFWNVRPKPSGPPVAENAVSAPSPESGSQDVISMTLVSQESGLRVYWYFNKNFDWKEE